MLDCRADVFAVRQDHPVRNDKILGQCRVVAPIAKNTRLQQKVETQTTLFTETWGFFSLTHEGTVVTKPKLNKTVPRTAACEPVFASVLTAGICQPPGSCRAGESSDAAIELRACSMVSARWVEAIVAQV